MNQSSHQFVFIVNSEFGLHVLYVNLIINKVINF
jgi:hypothetical protein